MYSDFFDPPDDVAAADVKRDSDADMIDEGMDYSSSDEKTLGKSGEKCGEDEGVETSDDDSATAAADDDGDDDSEVEQPPVKKAKHKLLADE